jgi:hypothetical protein
LRVRQSKILLLLSYLDSDPDDDPLAAAYIYYKK